MVSKCMVCDLVCREIECVGSIGNMEISFCDTHAGYCENCEKIICKVIREWN